MKRLHVFVSVENLDRSIQFYETLFGAKPSVKEADYAKWMLEDPRVNFAIGAGAEAVGIDHVGIQAETEDELAEIAVRLKAAGEPHQDQTDAHCCYARSDKTWVLDPQGIYWETFHTKGSSTHYGEDKRVAIEPEVEACCAADTAAKRRGEAACCGPAAS